MRGKCRSFRAIRYGVRSLWTSEIPAIRFGPWQIRHCSFCGLASAVPRGSQIEAPLTCMWSTAGALSWQATQADAIGELTSVVPWASHGAAVLQALTTPVQGWLVVQVHGVSEVHAAVTEPIFWEKFTARLLTVYGPEIATLHGLVALQMHGAAGVQTLVATPTVWVPLIPSGNVAFTFDVAKPYP